MTCVTYVRGPEGLRSVEIVRSEFHPPIASCNAVPGHDVTSCQDESVANQYAGTRPTVTIDDFASQKPRPTCVKQDLARVAGEDGKWFDLAALLVPDFRLLRSLSRFGNQSDIHPLRPM